jgi:hypothetical protein
MATDWMGMLLRDDLGDLRESMAAPAGWQEKSVFQMEIKRCPACYFCWFLHLDAPHLDSEAATSDDFSDEAAWWSLTPWTRDALAECARGCRVQSLRVVVACSCMVHNSARK